ncbi:glycoside hydrolase family protein [Salix suchowensis]|nr:glycoside hydrolase family protein [Salix suchowensis]
MAWSGPAVGRFYLDGKVRRVLEVQIENGGKLGGVGGPKGKSIFDRGDFPKTARNGSAEVVVQNPWDGAAASAPFDQREPFTSSLFPYLVDVSDDDVAAFHLVIDLSAGGTSGWFPDNLGGKPWYDGSETAMRDFFNAKDQWYQTWPLNEDERSFRMCWFTDSNLSLLAIRSKCGRFVTSTRRGDSVTPNMKNQTIKGLHNRTILCYYVNTIAFGTYVHETRYNSYRPHRLIPLKLSRTFLYPASRLLGHTYLLPVAVFNTVRRSPSAHRLHETPYGEEIAPPLNLAPPTVRPMICLSEMIIQRRLRGPVDELTDFEAGGLLR